MRSVTPSSLILYVCLTAVLLISSSKLLMANEIQVATASNFYKPLKEIALRYEQVTGRKVTIISGSTGKLYAQIIHGAPFDIFFSADIKRAELLDKEGLAVTNSRFTYAIGQLILWSPEEDYIDPQGNVLQHKDFRYLSIANPKLAPYGRAARESLEKMNLWKKLQGHIVRGENIGQTFQFVKTGNAQLGLVAYSQILHPGQAIEGSYWRIPETYYSPIKQQAVLLKDNESAHHFYAFVNSKESRRIIQSFGYGLAPEVFTTKNGRVDHAQ